MKCLTICQPYAHLFTLPASDPRHKRVENREWETLYRGPILLHAGMSTSWLDNHPSDHTIDINGIPYEDMIFGGIVAIANLVHIYHVSQLEGLAAQRDPLAAYTLHHSHTHGPFCWVFDTIRVFTQPPRIRGRQKLFNVDLTTEQLCQTEAVL